jgi:hypothetical protein
MKNTILLAGVIFFLFITIGHCEPTTEIDKIVSELEPKIGSFPPQISSELEREFIENKYLHAKQLLDAELANKPDQIDLLYKRGHLQSMGHNLDYPGSFEGSDQDLKAVLKLKPDHEAALIDLGELYANSSLSLVAKAEILFLAAQKAHGAEPLEGAQQGLFFVYYYQGNMAQALDKAKFLTKTWPLVEKYKPLEHIAELAMAREKAKRK